MQFWLTSCFRLLRLGLQHVPPCPACLYFKEEGTEAQKEGLTCLGHPRGKGPGTASCYFPCESSTDCHAGSRWCRYLL